LDLPGPRGESGQIAAKSAPLQPFCCPDLLEMVIVSPNGPFFFVIFAIRSHPQSVEEAGYHGDRSDQENQN
jgi:hypothetical protein